MKDETREILKKSLDEITSAMLSEKAIYNDDLILRGNGGIFDSLTLVSYIAEVETQISDKNNKSISIVSEKAFSMKNSPFRTMETLGQFIEELLNEA